MKKVELVGLGIRLFSIAIFLMALTKLASISIYFYENDNLNESMLSGISFITLLILSIVTWFFPIIIAKKILPVVKDEEAKINWSVEELKEAGLFLIGIYLLYKVISDAAFWIIIQLTGNTIIDGVDFEFNREDITNIYVTVIEFILACFMIFGARGIINFIKYIRLLGSK